MLVVGSQLRRAVALAVASAALAACIAVAVVQPAHAAKKAILPVTPNSFVGVVSDETFAALGSGNSSYLDSIRNAGVGLLRQKFDWDFLTFGNGPTNINWSYLDHFMTATSQQGITVMPVLFDPPASMTSAPAAGALRGNYPPTDLGAIGDFGAMLAAHYGTNGSFWAENPQVPRHPITAWQIWNEPSLPVYWQPAPNAAAYVQMLRLASQKIKAADRLVGVGPLLPADGEASPRALGPAVGPAELAHSQRGPRPAVAVHDLADVGDQLRHALAGGGVAVHREGVERAGRARSVHLLDVPEEGH